jgi:hypothetical protein
MLVDLGKAILDLAESCILASEDFEQHKPQPSAAGAGIGRQKGILGFEANMPGPYQRNANLTSRRLGSNSSEGFYHMYFPLKCILLNHNLTPKT